MNRQNSTAAALKQSFGVVPTFDCFEIIRFHRTELHFSGFDSPPPPQPPPPPPPPPVAPALLFPPVFPHMFWSGRVECEDRAVYIRMAARDEQ